MMRAARGLLLDFGGVLADAPAGGVAAPELVRLVGEVVGGQLPAERISADLVAGARAYSLWRDETSASAEPIELPHDRVWADFVTQGWPEPAREAVEREATSLAYAWTWRTEWAVRPGIPEALGAAVDAGLPMAVVSNALCGAAHRDFLAAAGLSRFFEVEFYSDETGLRKPNPRFAELAAEAIGVPIGQCWFVGDSLHRDVACARRAGTGAAVLMRSPRTDREPEHPDVSPDAWIEDGYGLLDLLHRSRRDAS
ncbi:HAD family hydrolase [Micromonospora radicis]|uniref:HAD family hydrolase n=1 Tax=Micromonospora radicis TaxID=1894971 RepID=A0A418MRD5_9ACTN|nr:HAD family hydrolase [Micromonospora radicis]RIV36430.1 HAD family hydrolase [Micromonospora radicis]